MVGTITLPTRTTISVPGVTVVGFGDRALLTNSASNVYAILEVVDASDVTVKNIRLRRTPNTEKATTGDGLSIVRSNNVLIENVSISWSIDGALDISGSQNVRVLNSIIAEPLRCNSHLEGCHSMAVLIDSSSNILFQGNLIVSAKERCPRVVSSRNVTIRDNLIYNCGSHPTVVSAERGVSTVNYLSNRLIAGPDSPAITYGVAVTNPVSAVGVYADKKAVREIDWRYVVVTPFGDVGTGAAFDIERVGAWPRDSTDLRLVECTVSRLCVIRDSVPN